MILRKTFRFEASHVLPKHPGKCSRLHGHSWVLHVFVEGSINPETGFVKDYAEISKTVNPVINELDHKHLGVHYQDFEPEAVPFQVPPSWRCLFLKRDFYPSSENLLWAIGRELTPPKLYTADSEINVYRQYINWFALAIEETCTSYAELTRSEFDAASH